MSKPPKAKKIVDLRSLFSYAESFAEAAEMLDGQSRRKPSGEVIHAVDAAHTAPMMVLDSFALELYVKCLHAIEFNGDPGWGHPCKPIFDLLKPGTQQAVQFNYNSLLATHPAVNEVNKGMPGFQPTLLTCLEHASSPKSMFETLRYFYEASSGPGNDRFYWRLPRMAFRATILSIRPDLRNAEV